jgi:phage gpG-like protein
MAFEKLNLADLPAFFEARARALEEADFTKPLKTIRLLLIAATKQNFANGSDPDGVPWAPLKSRQGLPLRDKGILMASISGSGIGSISELTSRGLRYGSSIEYAGIQNFGGTIRQPARERPYPAKPWVFKSGGRTVFTRKMAARSITIPARRFLGVTETLLGRFNEVLRKHIAGLMGDPHAP